jgi:hypothetical protein
MSHRVAQGTLRSGLAWDVWGLRDAWGVIACGPPNLMRHSALLVVVAGVDAEEALELVLGGLDVAVEAAA